MILLTEHLTPTAAALTEMRRPGGDMYLSGIMMQSEVVNGNGRKYSRDDLARVVRENSARLAAGDPIPGELNHPDGLQVNLANVSHLITEMVMDGNNVIGRMKLLNTPSGQVAKALIEGGMRLGVSSRGTGNVNESGGVSDFCFVTVDIVSTPSAPNAYPDVIQEALGSKKVMTLAEAVTVDPKCQAYLKREIMALIQAVTKGAK
jgi:hypothetical protein